MLLQASLALEPSIDRLLAAWHCSTYVLASCVCVPGKGGFTLHAGVQQDRRNKHCACARIIACVTRALNR
jgi:hypothetical protein